MAASCYSLISVSPDRFSGLPAHELQAATIMQPFVALQGHFFAAGAKTLHCGGGVAARMLLLSVRPGYDEGGGNPRKRQSRKEDIATLLSAGEDESAAIFRKAREIKKESVGNQGLFPGPHRIFQLLRQKLFLLRHPFREFTICPIRNVRRRGAGGSALCLAKPFCFHRPAIGRTRRRSLHFQNREFDTPHPGDGPE